MKNNRTFLEKLFDGAEVEWKPLMELAEIGTGNSNRQDEEENGKYPFYVRSKNILRSNSFQFDETAIIIPGEGGIGEIFHYVEGKYALHQRAYRIHITSDEVNPKFLYYIMHNSFKKYILSKSVGATAISIRKPMLEKFEIPIPPLPVQTKIIKILDALTALTSELTSELTLRRKQYEYYLDNLLSKEELGKIGFEWKCLKDICDYVDFRGKTPKKTESGIFLVTAKNIKKGFIDYNASKEFVSESDYIEIMRRGLPRIGDVLITTEAPCGNVAQIDKEDIALAQRVIKYRSSNENILDNTFLKFMLLSKEFQVNLIKLSTGGTVKGIKGSTLHKMKIKIPPIDEQKRIVSILEKFEILTNSITEGLPLAIEQSQKRYEYYRELLLSFNGSNQ